MSYLFSQYWMFIALALLLGVFVGWATCDGGSPRIGSDKWLGWAIAAALAGAFAALLRWIPGLAGHLLEVALLLFAAYVIGCGIGCGARGLGGDGGRAHHDSDGHSHDSHDTHDAHGHGAPAAAAHAPAASAAVAPVAAAASGVRLDGGLFAIDSSASYPGSRPTGLAAPRAGGADDLTRIAGLDPGSARALGDLGIWHFDQIAGWNAAGAQWVEHHLAWPGRVGREDWVGQARSLASGAAPAAAASVGVGGASEPAAADVSGRATGAAAQSADAGAAGAAGAGTQSTDATVASGSANGGGSGAGAGGAASEGDAAGAGKSTAAGASADSAGAIPAREAVGERAAPAAGPGSSGGAPVSAAGSAGGAGVGTVASSSGATAAVTSHPADGALATAPGSSSVAAGASSTSGDGVSSAASAVAGVGPGAGASGSSGDGAAAAAAAVDATGGSRAAGAAGSDNAATGSSSSTEGAPVSTAGSASAGPASGSSGGESVAATASAKADASAPASAESSAASASAPVAAAAETSAADYGRPAADPAPGAPADDLKLIKGIGPKNEAALNGLGVRRFVQIADWTPANAQWVGHNIRFPGRIERERWIDQARFLAAGVETPYAAAVRSGEITIDDSADAPMSEAEAAAFVANLPAQATQVEDEDKHAGSRPLGLAAARAGKADDLKLIKGIGKQNEERLHKLGVWHFDQIAAWTPENVKWIGSYLAFVGRIDRERWIEQAERLARGETTEFSRRVEAGDVPTSKG